MAYLEIDNLPVIRARHYTRADGRIIQFLVVHTPESPESDTSAEGVANYFASGKTIGSTHLTIDNNSAIRCVDDKDVAHGAGGGNSRGLHAELSGYASQSAAQWADTHSKAMLELAADLYAQWAIRYGIPVRRLTVAQLRNGEKGICGHNDIRDAFQETTHSDPGSNFPWNTFLERVDFHVRRRNGTAVPPQEPLKYDFDIAVVYEPGYVFDERLAGALGAIGYKKVLTTKDTARVRLAFLIGRAVTTADRSKYGEVGEIAGADRWKTYEEFLKTQRHWLSKLP